MEDPKHEFYTAREFAERLRISLSTVSRMIDDGDITALQVRDGWRIPTAAVEEYIRRNTRPALVPVEAEKVQL